MLIHNWIVFETKFLDLLLFVRILGSDDNDRLDTTDYRNYCMDPKYIIE